MFFGPGQTLISSVPCFFSIAYLCAWSRIVFVVHQANSIKLLSNDINWGSPWKVSEYTLSGLKKKIYDWDSLRLIWSTMKDCRYFFTRVHKYLNLNRLYRLESPPPPPASPQPILVNIRCCLAACVLHQCGSSASLYGWVEFSLYIVLFWVNFPTRSLHTWSPFDWLSQGRW